MKKKKVLSSLLALAMTASLFAGCGNAAETSTGGSSSADTGGSETVAVSEAEGTEQAASSGYQTTYGSKQFDDVTIRVELFDRGNAPEGSTITDNRWTKYVQEEMKKVGINVEFVAVPRADEVDKLTSMMAGGIAPDIVLTYTYSLAKDYYDQGGVWDLSEFVDGEGQAANLKEYLGEKVIDMGRTNEDELYGIVARRSTTSRSNFFVRKDWMDALGLSVPTTVDEVYNLIEQMVKNNPDGKKDVIGTTVWDNGYFLGAFSKFASDPVQSLISSNLTRDYFDEGMKEFYRFRNKLYNNGLLHPEYYALPTDDYISYIVNGSMATFEDHVGSNIDSRNGYALQTLKENYPGADLVAIPPLENIWDGKQYSTTYSSGGLIAFCPKTADEQTVEACVTYLDWMCTKAGGFTISQGFEGEHFEYDENGIPAVIDADYNTTDKNWISGDLFITGNGGFFETADDYSRATAKQYPGYEEYFITDQEYALTGDFIEDIDDSLYTSPSQAELAADINLVRDEWLVKVITCPESEFDANWDSYMSALKDAGVETVNEERTAYFEGK